MAFMSPIQPLVQGTVHGKHRLRRPAIEIPELEERVNGDAVAHEDRPSGRWNPDR